MEEEIIKLIKEYFGLSFLIGLILVGFFIFLVIWAVSIYFKIKKIDRLPCDKHSEKLELLTSISTKLGTLPCADHKSQLERQVDKHGSIETSISSINTSITYMQKSIDSLTQSLQRNKGIITDPFTQTHSPLSITSIGYDMIRNLGIDEIFENNWMRIRYLIEENTKSQNPYDIQQFCIEQAVVYPDKFLSENELNKIKLDAYHTGNSLTSYMKVIAIMARDRYFEENGINIIDVDTYDPNFPTG